MWGLRYFHLLSAQGHDVTVITRSDGDESLENGNVRLLRGDPREEGPWQDAAAEADVVINMAGESIFQWWSERVRMKIRDSRLLTTHHVVQAMRRGNPEGKLLLSASAVGYYGFHGDEKLDEEQPPGQGFLAELARDWESEALKANAAGIRTGILRFGVVLGHGGGALDQMIKVFRFGLGGKLGAGKQWFSWIHIQDLIRAILFLMNDSSASGRYNFTAPEPVRNAELTRAVARALGRPSFMTAPAFMIRLIMGEFSTVLLEGQRVVPARLLASGFEFKHPDIEAALSDLIKPAPA